MTYIRENVVRFSESPSVDAFGRARISEARSIFDYKSIYGLATDLWESETSGAGSSITHLPNEATVQLTAGQDAASALMQTYRYFPYISGRSFLVNMTGVLGSPQNGTIRRIGLYDDNNGLFFELDGYTLKVVKRSNATGSVVDHSVEQAEWNSDSLDGSGQSGFNIDPAKAQIFIIDFQWLGVGKVRFGFGLDDGIVYCHKMHHANIVDSVYMATPSLPLRYEVIKTSGSTSSMKAICCSVNSEAGNIQPGIVNTVSNTSLRTNISVRTPILAIRLKNTINSMPNRRTALIVDANTFISGGNALIEIIHAHQPSNTTGSWTSAGDDSAVEYSTDISAVSGGTSHVVGGSFVAAGTGHGSSPPPSAINQSNSSFINRYSYLSQNKASNKSQIMVIYVTPIAGTVSAAGVVTWAEFD